MYIVRNSKMLSQVRAKPTKRQCTYRGQGGVGWRPVYGRESSQDPRLACFEMKTGEDTTIDYLCVEYVRMLCTYGYVCLMISCKSGFIDSYRVKAT